MESPKVKVQHNRYIKKYVYLKLTDITKIILVKLAILTEVYSMKVWMGAFFLMKNNSGIRTGHRFVYQFVEMFRVSRIY